MSILIFAVALVAAFVLGVIFDAKHHSQISEAENRLRDEYRALVDKAHSERNTLFGRLGDALAALHRSNSAAPSAPPVTVGPPPQVAVPVAAPVPPIVNQQVSPTIEQKPPTS